VIHAAKSHCEKNGLVDYTKGDAFGTIYSETNTRMNQYEELLKKYRNIIDAF
jgi:hypothetical protein